MNRRYTPGRYCKAFSALADFLKPLALFQAWMRAHAADKHRRMDYGRGGMASSMHEQHQGGTRTL